MFGAGCASFSSPTGHVVHFRAFIESGDILSPEPGNPEGLKTRLLDRAEVGDIIVIGGAGAYCAAMSAKNYNSFPEAPEVLLGADGSPTLIRRRQTLEQMLANEILP